MQDANFLT